MAIEYGWRAAFGNPEVNRLHAEGFGHPVLEDDWWGLVERHSLGWVCARDGAGLVGFVNVAWDGGVHAFILDTLVATHLRHRGIGTAMVALAADRARAAGCEWLHADFDEELRAFYIDACRFEPTDAGVMALR